MMMNTQRQIRRRTEARAVRSAMTKAERRQFFRMPTERFKEIYLTTLYLMGSGQLKALDHTEENTPHPHGTRVVRRQYKKRGE